mmetsp:Transcript_35931/g.82505  ORF Transcript_35931/g.82505 Transcript_35931/m.82505 type:complete len:266 (-) Transcript_35931:149-946(-)
MGWGEGQSGAGGKGFKVLPANAASTVWIGGVPAGITHDEIKRNFEAAGSVKRVQLMGSSGTGFAWMGSPQEAQNAITMFNGSQVNGSTLQVDPWTGGGGGGGGKGKGKGGPSWGSKGGSTWSKPSWGGGGKGESSWGGGGGGGGGGWGGGKGGGDGAWQPFFQKLLQGFGKGGGKGKQQQGFKVLPSNVASTVWIGGIPEGVTFEEIKTNFGAAGTCKKVQLLGKTGQGLAWFSSAEEAANAIRMFNGSTVNGSILQVDVWTRKE